MSEEFLSGVSSIVFPVNSVKCVRTQLLHLSRLRLVSEEGAQANGKMNKLHQPAAYSHMSKRVRNELKPYLHVTFCFCRCGNVNFARRTSCNRCGRGESPFCLLLLLCKA